MHFPDQILFHLISLKVVKIVKACITQWGKSYVQSILLIICCFPLGLLMCTDLFRVRGFRQSLHQFLLWTAIWYPSHRPQKREKITDCTSMVIWYFLSIQKIQFVWPLVKSRFAYCNYLGKAKCHCTNDIVNTNEDLI